MNCGSEKGWFQHKAANTPPCKWCAPYNPKLAQPKKPGPAKGTIPSGDVGRPLAPCGTASAARRHQDRGEPVDELCREAARAYGAAYRAARKAKEATQ